MTTKNANDSTRLHDSLGPRAALDGPVRRRIAERPGGRVRVAADAADGTTIHAAGDRRE